MPQWGRPPGAYAERDGGAWKDEFESRRRRYLDLDGESDSGYRAYLDPTSIKSRSMPRLDQGAFAGDELLFTGYDVGSEWEGRGPRTAALEYGAHYRASEEESYYEEPRSAFYRSSREDALVQSASEKLRKARTKGNTNVSLSVEEMAALERSTMQPRESAEPRTPTKPKVRGSRSNSSTSLARTRQRKTSAGFLGGSSPSKARSRTPKTSRTTSSEQQPTAHSTGSTPPAFMIRGPDGASLYASSDYYPSNPPRRTSAGDYRQVTPPYDMYSGRFYGAPSEMRPSSSSSSRGGYDERAWPPRSSSNSGAPYPDTFADPSPPAQARRVPSGSSADIAYAKLRRPPQNSPLSAVEPTADNAMGWASRAGASRQSSEGSSDDSGAGVRIEVEPQVISRVPVNGKTGGSRSVSRRKGR